jgi:hypothetical protein
MQTTPKAGVVANVPKGKAEDRPPLDTPSRSTAQPPELDAARERLEADRQIADWCLELRSRLERAEAFLLHPDCRSHHATLASEIERFKLCISLAKKARRP